MKSFSVTTENRKNMIIMADYIDKEAALSLVQPDEPEDEKAAITIATAKKLIRSIIQRMAGGYTQIWPRTGMEKMSVAHTHITKMIEATCPILTTALTVERRWMGG